VIVMKGMEWNGTGRDGVDWIGFARWACFFRMLRQVVFARPPLRMLLFLLDALLLCYGMLCHAFVRPHNSV